MEITEIRVKLVSPGRDKLRAFCSITLDDCFVVRDLKVIEGQKGSFVAMPSRKLTIRCPGCSVKNSQGSNYCNGCGKRQPQQRLSASEPDRFKLHADVAHPINAECRHEIQSRVLSEYAKELVLSKEDPNYLPASLDTFDEYEEDGSLCESGSRLEPGLSHAGDSKTPGGPTLGGPTGSDSSVRSAGSEGSDGLTGGERASGDVEHDGEESVRRRGLISEREPRNRPADDGDSRSGGRGDTQGDDVLRTQRPPLKSREEFFEDDDGEPEDNFGAGLFS